MDIVLSARVLNPSLTNVSRTSDDASVTKLIRAGANRAISPYAIRGHRLAHLILSPAVVDFFETALRRGAETLNIEDLAVQAGGPGAGPSTSWTCGAPPPPPSWPSWGTAARR